MTPKYTETVICNNDRCSHHKNGICQNIVVELIYDSENNVFKCKDNNYGN